MAARQKILITGATGTIGRGIARALAAPGRTIALHCHRSRGEAEALERELVGTGTEAFVVQADLARCDEIARFVGQVFEKAGGVDLFVHSAACFERTPFGTVTEEQWARLIDLDLKAAFFLAQEVGMRMRREGGKMIFLSDVAAVRPYAGYLPYCMAKAGIDALVRGLAKSLAPTVQVNAIAPYVVTRPAGITDQGWAELLSKMPSRRAQTAEEVAAAVNMLSLSSESITGQVIAVDGGRLLR